MTDNTIEVSYFFGRSKEQARVSFPRLKAKDNASSCARIVLVISWFFITVGSAECEARSSTDSVQTRVQESL